MTHLDVGDFSLMLASEPLLRLTKAETRSCLRLVVLRFLNQRMPSQRAAPRPRTAATTMPAMMVGLMDVSSSVSSRAARAKRGAISLERCVSGVRLESSRAARVKRSGCKDCLVEKEWQSRQTRSEESCPKVSLEDVQPRRTGVRACVYAPRRGYS